MLESQSIARDTAKTGRQNNAEFQMRNGMSCSHSAILRSESLTSAKQVAVLNIGPKYR